MNAVKVRRVGNSNVVSLPKGMDKLGFAEGTSVFLIPTRTGEIVMVPADRLDAYIDALGQRVVEENREALEILAAHDRDEAQANGLSDNYK
jgi:antitoxin component of MazEF toxin-antitoxin module